MLEPLSNTDTEEGKICATSTKVLVSHSTITTERQNSVG